MQNVFEDIIMYFSTQVAGKLLVLEQEKEGSMVENLFKTAQGRTYDNIEIMSANVSRFMAVKSKLEMNIIKVVKMDDKVLLPILESKMMTYLPLENLQDEYCNLMFEKQIAMWLGLLQKSHRNKIENDDMENDYFLFEVNLDTVQTKYNSNEGYSWIKGYIDADFIQEKMLEILIVSSQIKFRSDFYCQVEVYIYCERSAPEYVKILKCVRLSFQIGKPSKVKMEDLIFMFVDPEDDKYSNANTAIDTYLSMSINFPIDKEGSFIEKVSDIKIITHVRDVKDFGRIVMSMKPSILGGKCPFSGLSVNDENEVVTDEVIQGKATAKMMLRVIHCIKDDNIKRNRDIVSPAHSSGAPSSHFIWLYVTNASRQWDESYTSRRLEEFKASKADEDRNVMKRRLSLTERKLQCSNLTAFDYYYEAVNDSVHIDDGQGAVDH